MLTTCASCKTLGRRVSRLASSAAISNLISLKAGGALTVRLPVLTPSSTSSRFDRIGRLARASAMLWRLAPSVFSERLTSSCVPLRAANLILAISTLRVSSAICASKTLMFSCASNKLRYAPITLLMTSSRLASTWTWFSAAVLRACVSGTISVLGSDSLAVKSALAFASVAKLEARSGPCAKAWRTAPSRLRACASATLTVREMASSAGRVTAASFM